MKIMLPVMISSFLGNISFRVGAWIGLYIFRVHKNERTNDFFLNASCKIT